MKEGALPKIIWGGLLYTQFSYGYVCHSQQGEFLFDIGSFLSVDVGPTMMVAAIIVLGLSYFIPKLILKKVRAKSFKEASKKFLLPFIVKLILLESVTIYGLVLSFVAEKNLLGPFLFASLTGFLLSFPTLEKIKRATRLLV